MSDSSDSLILPPSEELKKAAAEELKNRKKKYRSTDSSEEENEKVGKTTKSPNKIRHSTIPLVEETNKELKYRRKHFGDVNDIATSRKLRCTACFCSLQSVVLEGRDVFHHPVLKVLMCKSCIGFYGDGDLSLDEDGSDKYCRWCGQGGTLYCCSKCSCAFCKRCIKRNLNRSILDEIEDDDWKCFVCNGEPLWELRAICTNAQAFSKKIHRSRKEENQRNLQHLIQKKSRPLNRQRRRKDSSSSSSSEDESVKRKSKRNDLSKNKRKRQKHSSSNSDEGKQLEKKPKTNSCDSDSEVQLTEVRNKTIECVVLSDSDDGTSSKKQRKKSSNVNKKDLQSKISNDSNKNTNNLKGNESHSDELRSDCESKKQEKEKRLKNQDEKSGEKNSRLRNEDSKSDKDSDSGKKKTQKRKSVTRKNKSTKRTSSESDMSSVEDTSEDEKKNKKKRQLKSPKGIKGSTPSKKRRIETESDSDKDDTDDSKSKKVRHKKKSKQKSVKAKEEILDSDESTVRGNTSKSKRRKEGSDDCSSDDAVQKETTCEKLPDEVDTKSAEIAFKFIEDHITELENLGQLLSYRAKRIREKKVNEEIMNKPRKVGEIVDNMKLLMKLATENMEHTGGYLSLHHKYWKKRIIRKRKSKKVEDSENMDSKKTGIDNGKEGLSNEEKSNNNERSKKKSKTPMFEESDQDMDVTVNGMNLQTDSTSANDATIDSKINDYSINRKGSDAEHNVEKLSDGNNEGETADVSTNDGVSQHTTFIENDSNSQVSADISKLNDKESNECSPKTDDISDHHEINKAADVEKDDSEKRRNEISDSDREETNSETNDDSMKSRKRRRIEDTEEKKNDSEDSDETALDNVEVPGQPEEETTAFDDESKTHSDICPNTGENSEETEENITLKTKGKDNTNNADMDENDKDTVISENSEVSLSLLKNITDAENLPKTVDDMHDTTLNDAKKALDVSIGSLSTVQFDLNDSRMSEDLFADTVSNLDTNATEEVKPESPNDNVPEEPNTEDISNLETRKVPISSLKNEDMTSAQSNEDYTIKENDKDSDSECETIECLFDEKYDSEDKDEEKNEVDPLDSVSESPMKRKQNKDITEDNSECEMNDKPDKNYNDDTANDDEKDKHLKGTDTGKSSPTEEQNKNRLEICKEKTNMSSEPVDNEKNANTNEKDEEGNEEEVDDNCSSLNAAENAESSEEEEKEASEKSSEGENGKNDDVLTEECLKAQQALLGSTSNDEDEDEDDDMPKKRKLRRKKMNKKTKDEDTNHVEDSLEEKKKRKKKPGPKSKTCTGNESLSSSVSSEIDTDSECSNDGRQKKLDIHRKKKLKLKNLEIFKQDEKLNWKCTVDVESLADEEFQRYYEKYYSDEDEEEECDKKINENREIKRLVNLKSLKKGSGKARMSDGSSVDSDEEDSGDETTKKKKKSKKDKKKEQEQKLIDFFNQLDEDEKKVSSDASGSEQEVLKTMKLKKKSLIELENEMSLKVLLAGSSSGDSDNNGSEEEVPEEKEKKKKKKDKTKIGDDSPASKEEENDDTVKEQEENDDTVKEQEENGDTAKEGEENIDAMKDENDDIVKDKENDKKEEESGDTAKKEENEEEAEGKEKEEKNDDDEKKKKDSVESNDDKDSSDDDKPKKKNWRKDKLLIEKLSDLDTSDEERLWKAKKEREMKMEDTDTEEKTGSEKMARKKKVRRRILGSDDDTDVVISSSDSSSDAFVKKKKKKKAKQSDSDKSDSSDSEAQNSKKVKRKRIKAPASDSSSSDEDEDGPKSETPGKGRKNIHRIMKDENVGEATRRAAREEEERRKRIVEKQKMYNEIFRLIEGVEKVDKLVLDFNPETKEELVSVDPFIVTKLKPHQVKGVKFMWDASFESLKRIQKSPGSGCILAHCMGLGKTFQVVALVHTLLNNKKTGMRTVLVVCPLSTVLNWVNEFNMWLKDIGDGDEVNVFELSKYRQNYERMYQLKDWQESGGVMVIGYDMFRNLTNPQTKRMRKKAVETFQSTLVDPGPDLVVCDEGHLLKNEDTALAKAMRRIRTLRRIVLTGTPLQNNLREYHCMVQFVKPNLLGTRREFLNRFVNPISNGQFEDSTAHDVKIMKRRAHVLHKMLEGSVQRFDYSVLTPFLPPKYEYVISIRLCEVQVKAYRYYLENYAMGAGDSGGSKGAKLFTDFQNLQRIWTHPRVIQMSAERAEKTAERKRLMESEDSEGSLRDFIDDDDETTTPESSSDESSSDEDSDIQILDGEEKKGKSKKKSTNKYTRSTRSKGLIEEPEEMEADNKENEEDEKKSPYMWWKQFIQGDELDNVKYSGKLVLLFSILRECEKIGDKVLVFSQSLFSLDLIEHFLGSIDNATQNGEGSEVLDNNTGSWSMGLDYFRLDGSTSTENRNIWCKAFNREDNHRARLFIISTRAGGLGINLYAANRVIIFDASWNPSHDVQSIFRVYRFGQKKPCYIYRFLAQGTMEEKIYDRQVTKLSLSCRVVDEQQIERHYNMADLQELYQFDPEQKTKRPTPILPKDRLLAELLKEHEQWIVTYHEHDSLLENKEEEELNEEERKAAWEEYENEKKGKVLPSITGQSPLPLNIPALREAIRNENPQATDEQLDQKLTIVLNQICEFMSNQQNGAVTANLQYTPAQIQALQQYRLQQEQLLRLRLQQQAAAAAAAAASGYQNVPNASLSFKQYMQDLKSVPPLSMFSNAYRNTNTDKTAGGVLRMQSKLVPFNTPSSSSMMAKNYGKTANDHLISRQPVMLPLANSNKRGMSILKQPLPAHASSKGQGSGSSRQINLDSDDDIHHSQQRLAWFNRQLRNSNNATSIPQPLKNLQKTDKKESVPDTAEIETID